MQPNQTQFAVHDVRATSFGRPQITCAWECSELNSKLQSAWAGALAIVFSLLDLIRYDASILAGTLVDLGFVPCPLALCLEFVTAGAELSNGLLGQKLLQSPLLNVLLLILF